MGQVHSPSPVLLLLAAFSRHDEALAWARAWATQAWGDVALESPAYRFSQTDYYQATMGPGLRKQFWVFSRLLADPAKLADAKLEANTWETEYARSADHAEPRPLNLDPGYLTLGKLVLASTKDHAHRIYLGRGIFAEVTLYYRHGRWRHHEWTYPDYRRDDYQRFFSECREYLHRQLKEEP